MSEKDKKSGILRISAAAPGSEGKRIKRLMTVLKNSYLSTKTTQKLMKNNANVSLLGRTGSNNHFR